MDPKIYKKFDEIMSKLKKIEPSASFDSEFRKKLLRAEEEKQRESVFESLVRRTRESIRYALLPKAPALATTAAAFIALMAIGLYIYATQPADPILVAKKGIVFTQGAKDAEWKTIGIAQKLKVGDIVTTKEGSQVDIELSGKYTMRAKERTRFKIAKLTPRYGKGEASFELIEGKMLISINEGFKGSRFIIDTKAAETRALGTKFSVDVSRKETTDVKVLEGKVEVKGRYKPEKILLAKQAVVVGAGQKTEVNMGELPSSPQRLAEGEWRQLEELYQIGRKPQVILLVKNTPNRVKDLLRPCPIYISDEEPREIPELLEEAALKVKEALETKDKAKHLEVINVLERIVDKHPNPNYDVQFLLYIGAYYEYLGYHKDSIKAFEKVIEKYPDSPLVSMAFCAIGIIYDEKLNNKKKAEKAFRAVLKRYPNSLEAIWVEKNEKIVSN